MAEKTVARVVVETLRDIGVKHVFGVPSGGWVDYMEALRTTDGIEFILATHEGGAAMMADVCGRITGVPGVCFGTYGPGATNLATGVGEALLDRSPMIAFSDEMPEKMRGRVTQMGIDHQALFAPLTKATTRLTPDGVQKILTDAAKTALTGRPGPVHVGLPTDISGKPAKNGRIEFMLPAPARPAAGTSLDAAVKLIEKSRKPVMAIGLGAIRVGAASKALELAERLAIPVVITPMAKGAISEDHRLYAGVLFHALSDLVGKTHKESDLVIAVGYDPVEFNYESWVPSVPLINLDIEPVDIDREVYPEVQDVVGNISSSLDYLLERPLVAKQWDLDALATRRAEMFARLAPEEGSFGPKAVLGVLREILPSSGIMACDVGAHTHLIGQQWRTPEPGLQIMTNGWSTMGFGIPAAIAAKLSSPEREVCAVVGDGGFLMTVGELATAVRYGVKVVIVLLTDNDLALIRIKQEKKGNPIYGTPVREKGAIGAPELFGVPVYSANDKETFRAMLKMAFGGKGPVVVEAIVNSREYDSLVLKKDKS